MGPLRPVADPVTRPFLAEASTPGRPAAPGFLSRAEIAAEAEAALRRQVPAAFVNQVAELTGGVPWLVGLVLENHEGEPDFTDPLGRPLVNQLGHELETTHSELHELLLALSVGFDLAGPLPAGLSGDDVDDLMTRARSAGLLQPDGRLVPLIAQVIHQTTPAYRLRALQRGLVDALAAEGLPLDDVAEGLVGAGMKDHRLAGTLERAGDAVLLIQPTAALARYEQAEAAGSNRQAIAARRAQAASAMGDLDLAARILDDLLSHPDPPDLGRAVDVAAAVWAQRAMLQRSADLYRWLGPERIGTSASLAAVAMIGVGDRDSAEGMLRARSGSGSPTLLSVGIGLMGEGLRDSTTTRIAEALTALMRASDMMTAAHVVTPLPELPAALAALVALHSGELAVADSILGRALDGEQGGPVARPRLLLLRAWVAMQADQTEQSRTLIQQATVDTTLAPRDELLHRALEVGLARRADDAPGLVRAWHRAREDILHVPIDLYSLLPLGELVVAATRLRDSGWLEVPLAEAWSLLDRLGSPPLWSAPLHWSAVQSAILADRPTELAPHAAALVRASSESHTASVLAAAGRAWVAVRAGHFEVAAVDEAARALASIGLAWDGARLAGHAAARTDERKDMARLLSCARSLHTSSANSRPPSDDSAVPKQFAVSPRAVGTARDVNGLSAREREVAQLVLEGNTYEEIGEAIFISPRTVEHHVARIRRQLGVSTRSEMLAELRHLLGADDASTH